LREIKHIAIYFLTHTTTKTTQRITYNNETVTKKIKQSLS